MWPTPDKGEIEIIDGSIDIPVTEGGSKDMRNFLPEKTDEPWKTETLREASNSRKVTRDIGSDDSILEIIDDFGLVRDLKHGLEIGSIAREWWSIHPDDPLSAEGKTHWTEERSRGAWKTRTETYAKMNSDAENFYIYAKLKPMRMKYYSREGNIRNHKSRFTLIQEKFVLKTTKKLNFTCFWFNHFA